MHPHQRTILIDCQILMLNAAMLIPSLGLQRLHRLQHRLYCLYPHFVKKIFMNDLIFVYCFYCYGCYGCFSCLVCLNYLVKDWLLNSGLKVFGMKRASTTGCHRCIGGVKADFSLHVNGLSVGYFIFLKLSAVSGLTLVVEVCYLI